MTIPPHPTSSGQPAHRFPPVAPAASGATTQPDTERTTVLPSRVSSGRSAQPAVPSAPVVPTAPAVPSVPAASPHPQSSAQHGAPRLSRKDLKDPKGKDSAPTPEDLSRAKDLLGRVTKTFAERVVGQDQLRIAMVSTLIAGGHILLESVPGLAKTTAAQTLAAAVSGSFHRIQCTPDLMPNDIIGTQILNYASGEMTTQLGPVHANLVLLDEINRSSAKTQSAMLEAMQERQTSIGGVVYPLPKPFMVLATQNPIEEEGTYILPEAQMDRFLMKEVLTYPRPAEEAVVLDRVSKGTFNTPITTTPITTEDVLWLQATVDRVWVDPVIKQYIVALVNTSRGGGPRPVPGIDRHVRVGASPRGGIALMKVAQAIALQAGRTYVTPDDIGLLRHSVLRHRLVRTYDALADDVAPESIIDAIFAAVPTP
ncbi:AAA family ATPase [Actinomyces trachealis]|uniref:AAA family ATPase n=1 Tax=Actinomyces trachealis TaxID=2763540 RepID=UPI001FD5ADF1|nr:AAA family ATPase [Actinomyces trachealis]